MKHFILVAAVLSCICIGADAKHIIDLNTGNGLSSSLVNCMIQDRAGDIWIGTEYGLNRYNGVRVKVYKAGFSQTGLPADNNIRTIVQTGNGNIYIGTQKGIQIYDRENDCFSSPLKTVEGDVYQGNVNCIVERSDGEIWISGNRLMKLDFRDTSEPVLVPVGTQLPDQMTGDILEDESGDLWMSKYNSGIYRLTKGGELHHYSTEYLEGPYNKLSTGCGSSVYAADNSGNVVRFDRDRGQFVREQIGAVAGNRINTLYCTDDGTVYLGTDGNGVFLKNALSGEVSKMSVTGIPFNIRRSKIHSILSDRDGNVWLGVYQRGVIMIPPESSQFWYLGHLSSDYDLIGTNSVTSLLVDSRGKVWVGTDNDGIYQLDQPLRLGRHYSMREGIPGNCFNLLEDSYGNIWFGSYSKGVRRIIPGTGKVQSGGDITGTGIDALSVYALAEDSKGRLWMGCMGDDIFYIDLKTGQACFPDWSGADISRWVDDFLILGNTLYAASYDGLYEIDIEGDEPVIRKHVFAGKVIRSMVADSDVLYCCTTEGICTLSLTDGKTAQYTDTHGLADNMVHDALVVSPGWIWFSTGAGLSLFNTYAGSFSNYYADDGFLVSEFSWKASAYDGSGLLLFGGSDGITIFNPDNIRTVQVPIPVRIVEIQTASRSLPITEDNSYVLSHNDNSCTVSFTTANYDAPAGVVFSYSTDGRQWTDLPVGQSNITLSKLSPGKYDLLVRAVDKGNRSEPVHVSIRVSHPWWGSWPAKLFYGLLVVMASAFILVLIKRNFEDKRELERYEQAQQVSEDKVRFFINLSHEIRSPLTLISAPLESLMENDTDPSRQRTYSIMKKSVSQVLRVVNQMLDIRKLEKGKMALKFRPVNIVEYVSSIVMLFREQAGLKGIDLSFRYHGLKETETWIDPDNFDKVIINLLSNAIKYTPDGGNIYVTVSNDTKNAIIEVKDTGVGISSEDMDKIFDRFYQVPGSNSETGTGIGLNLARMLVERHYGSISVSHNPDGQGSVFSVSIPLGNAHLNSDEIADGEPVGVSVPGTVDVVEAVTDSDDTGDVIQNRKRKTVLVAEDNTDIRNYLKNELSGRYNVILSKDGKDAYTKVLADMPDIVISDVVMPQADGFQLCRKLRNNPNVSHIPIILLTARTMDQDHVEGMAAGADAYITKPFNIKVLEQTVSSLLGTRDKLKVSFSGGKIKEGDIKDVKISTPDDRLMERLIKVLNENISNQSLTVEDVAAEVGISRVHLHRKLKELTNQTSRDFIRNVRLKKAAELLKEKKYSIAELAYAVGFSNPSTFSTSFRELFGMSPSEYRNSIENEQDNLV